MHNARTRTKTRFVFKPRFSVKPHFFVKPVGRAISIAVTLAAVSPIITLAQTNTDAPAITHQQTREFNIPAGSLSLVLSQFAGAADIALSFDAAQFAGLNSPGLQGRYSLEQGFATILAGSGFQAVAQGNRDFVLKKVPRGDVGQLSAVKVEADAIASLDGSTESAMSYTTGKVSVGKTDTALKDIPQTISVISYQQIQDQNLTDMYDVLDQAPGLTLEAWGGAQTQRISSRGFQVISFRYDGGAPTTQAGNNYTYLAGLISIDHVEILRGSDALFSGAGDPGGSVNLVRKRPTAESQLKLNASIGSWENYNAEVDAGGSITDSWRGRVVATAQDRNFFHDRTDLEKQAVFAVTEFDISDASLLTLGGSLEHQEGTPWVGGGIPDYEDGSSIDLPRSTSFTFDWSNRDTEISDVFVKYKHSFSDDWTFNLNSSHRQEVTDEYLANVGYGYLLVNKETGILPSAFTTIESDIRILQTVVDANINGSFALFDREHSVLFGLDWQRMDFSMWSEEGWGIRDLNVLDFDPADFPRPEEVSSDLKYSWADARDDKQLGAYTSGRFEIIDNLHVILGGRWSNIAGDVDYDKNEFTPYVGFTYALTTTVSVYGSVADVFKSQQYYFDTNNNPLEPMTGRNHEIGVKTSLWDGLANGYIALYRIERENEGVAIPGSVYPCCYVANGLVISEGVEVELTGEVMPNWNLAAAYTYNKNENRQNNSFFNSVTPRDLLKLWTTYQLSGNLSAWKVGGGWNKQSKFVSYGKDLPGFDTWSLFTEYRINDHLTASINAENIFDKKYFSSAGWYGEPRNYSLNLRAQF